MIEASDMSFEDQVDASSHAAIWMGVHGASLSHGLFMQPKKGTLIEVGLIFYNYTQFVLSF